MFVISLIASFALLFALLVSAACIAISDYFWYPGLFLFHSEDQVLLLNYSILPVHFPYAFIEKSYNIHTNCKQIIQKLKPQFGNVNICSAECAS